MTPFSVASLTASRYAGIGLAEISFGRNWRFALTNALVVCGVLALMSMAMQR
jgi:Mg2+/citrate symporter